MSHEKPKLARLAAFVALLAGLIYLLSLYISSGLGSAFWSILEEKELAYHISQDYEGWVIVRHGDEGCKIANDDTTVITIDPHGKGCGREAFSDDWIKRRYFFVTENNQLSDIPDGLIHAQSVVMVDPRSNNIEIFFVGDEALLDRSWDSKPDISEIALPRSPPGETDSDSLP